MTVSASTRHASTSGSRSSSRRPTRMIDDATCPYCDEVIVGAVTRSPEVLELQPCGHEVLITTDYCDSLMEGDALQSSNNDVK